MLKLKSYILFVSIAAIFAGISCSKASDAYVVTGKLENVKDTVFYAAREAGDSLHVDTIRINKKGEFSFSGMVDTLTVISLYFKESAASPYVLVDKGWKVKMNGDINFPDLIAAKGGDINNDLTKFKSENDELLKSRSELVKQKNDQSATNSDTISSKQHVLELKNVNFELLNIASDYVKHNPTKIASVILINNFFKNEESLERLSTALDQLRGAAYDFPLAVQLREYKSKISKSAVGSYAPSFSMADINGKKVSLSDFRGKYLLLSFVSTTCGLCTEMQPTVIKEYDILKKEKMNIEFISIVKDIEELSISETDLKKAKWITLPEYGGWASVVFEDYNIKEVPYSILISKDGKILERNVTTFNLKNRLEGYPDIKKQ